MHFLSYKVRKLWCKLHWLILSLTKSLGWRIAIVAISTVLAASYWCSSLSYRRNKDCNSHWWRCNKATIDWTWVDERAKQWSLSLNRVPEQVSSWAKRHALGLSETIRSKSCTASKWDQECSELSVICPRWDSFTKIEHAIWVIDPLIANRGVS